MLGMTNRCIVSSLAEESFSEMVWTTAMNGDFEELCRGMGMNSIAVLLGRERRFVKSKEWQNGSGTSFGDSCVD